ncbi:hypothetical protein LB523_11905 [Mesorhizobium sp. ESP-6-4]|uniref:hypothetical protein n=1 Tax=Mesorhizobium sp. ESP-6-4 TaxID=2876624 RepID=UPI001CCD815B|nr:hypothetical protein [Mesorhizobium sp. ESP-6-4]MBZ9659749.1 hypothetical protein [Mesorhizobium sp. ESP-6-4]
MNILLSLYITAFCAWLAWKSHYAFAQGWWLIGGALAVFTAGLLALAWLPI